MPSSSAMLESKYVSDKQAMLNFGIETLSSSYVQRYNLNSSDKLKKCYWYCFLSQGEGYKGYNQGIQPIPTPELIKVKRKIDTP